ncbi:hypothetical protein [Bradyrhizobium sp. CCBAU 21362]|uniref:hypothetical protein n=1 Tax=Bradyrhizobium sp. CCBAU 21362 TaxID=1325082 RepID=UPI0023055890|nr:hypothetical protein [Bradyrhizobium sp. CCBAU 21362]
MLPSIQRTQREDQLTLLQSWQSKRVRSERPMLKRAPQSTCGAQPKLEIRVERQIEHDSRPARRKLAKPKAMLRAPERQDCMPSIRRATNLATWQVGDIELGAFRRHALGYPHMKHGRQNFGGPEDC